MKKLLLLGIVVLSISSGCSLFAPSGGTLKLINDTMTVHSFRILFDGEYVQVNDGQSVIQPNQTIKAVSNVDTSFTVYSGSNLLWTGILADGEIIEKRFSTLP
jgi:hypothetical protein